MKIKGFIVALLTVFFFAGTALAGGPATMKTDVPTIPEADCDQAGWISLEVLGGFDLHEGDQIVWSTTNLVPLCKDIDIFLSVTELATKTYPTATERAIFATSAADTITVTDFAGTDITAGAIANAAGDAWELGFLIRGTAGSNQIRLTVTRRFSAVATNLYDAALNPTGNYVGQIGRGLTAPAGVALGSGTLIMTFNAVTNPTDVLTIRLFDSNNDAFVAGAAGQAGWWERDTVAPFAYDQTIEPEDNVLCLDTNNDANLVNGQYVWATPDSQPGTVPGASQVSFSGDYTVANISGTEGYTTTTVAKGQCETFSIGTELDQFGNPISDFVTLDVGSYNDGAAPLGVANRWTDQTGTCEEGDGFGVLISKSTTWGSAERYGISLTLAVSNDGGSTYSDADSDAAWFLAAPLVYETTADALGNVQGAADPAVLSNAIPSALVETIDGVNYTYGYDFVGAVDAFFNVLDVDNDSFMIDVSSIRIDKAAFTAGEVLALRVVVRKFPCGEVEEAYICLGTAVENCPTAGTSFSRFFPYGVGADNTAFWTGIAITNTGDTDGTAVVTFYGTEGGMSTYTIDVAARDIETFAMGAIMGDLVGDLTGAENFQAMVAADFVVDGIMFIGGKGTNTVLHGYLPR